MGIKDLLRFMKPYIEPIHVKKYAGKRVGIDAYSWLHKGAYSCSMELCLDSKSKKKLRYLNYFMHRVNLLRYHRITPVVVFDGANIPCKAGTENERYRKRKENRELAIAKLKDGDVSAAIELFQRAVGITPAMAHPLIQILKSEKVEFVVAPYEADAQLAYLATLEAEKGGVAAVITEDSDLIAYGCPAITFKMDRYGNGEELVLSKVFDSLTSKPSFRNFDQELFTGMCVLAGCDFLPSVPGIGIVKAHSLVTKYRNLDRVLSVLKIKKGCQMPEDYFKSFKEAVAVFQHARIYDAEIKELKHLKPLTEHILQHLNEGLDFLGPEVSQSVAAAIAEGKLDPSTMEAFDSSRKTREKKKKKAKQEQKHFPFEILVAATEKFHHVQKLGECDFGHVYKKKKMVRPIGEKDEAGGHYKGVCMRKWGKWVAQVQQPNSRERIWLGTYKTAEEAARAYDAAVFCLRGNSAKLNFPDNPPEISDVADLTTAQIKEAAFRHACTVSAEG